jgi:hypothetical protein
MKLNRHTLFIPGCYYRFTLNESGEPLPYNYKEAFKILSSEKDANLGDNDRRVTIKFKRTGKESQPLSFIRKHCEAVPDIIGLIEVGE